MFVHTDDFACLIWSSVVDKRLGQLKFIIILLKDYILSITVELDVLEFEKSFINKFYYFIITNINSLSSILFLHYLSTLMQFEFISN